MIRNVAIYLSACVLGVCVLSGAYFALDMQGARAQVQVGASISGAGMKAVRPNVVPHRALYDVALTSVKSGGQVVDIRGQLYFEWKKTCESWTTDHKSSLVYEYSDGTAVRMNSGFAAYETLDGKTLNFSSKRENNGTVIEELRGHAAIDNAQGGGATYSVPQNLTHPLPSNTFFPMQHTIEMLARAQAGERFFHATLFDGSDDKGPQPVNAFIGGRVDAAGVAKGRRGVDASLLNVPARKIRVAFFAPEAEESAAESEMDLVLLDNGVVSDIQIIYDNFTVQQKLVALEKMPQPICARASSY